jgi:hypothetical protein
MGSTSIIRWEAAALTSPTAAPSPALIMRGGLATFEFATGGEVATLSRSPRWGCYLCIIHQRLPDDLRVS